MSSLPSKNNTLAQTNTIDWEGKKGIREVEKYQE